MKIKTNRNRHKKIIERWLKEGKFLTFRWVAMKLGISDMKAHEILYRIQTENPNVTCTWRQVQNQTHLQEGVYEWLS